nr:hypothetical protein [Actinobacillus ureae]
MLGKNKLPPLELTPRVFSRRKLFTGFFAKRKLIKTQLEQKIDRLLPHRNTYSKRLVTAVVNVSWFAR